MNLWKYTDDVVVFMIMGVWSFGKVLSIIRGVDGSQIVEDTYMMLALGYAFGNIVQKSKLYIPDDNT